MKNYFTKQRVINIKPNENTHVEFKLSGDNNVYRNK